jgi:para-nitrobenzyl esterase
MKPLMKKLILFLLATAQVYMAIAQTNNLLQVKTANGLLQGAVDSSGIRSFKGIPFARPPVGDLRWKEPQPPANWKGVRDAGHFGPQAMQRRIYSDMMFRSAGTGEDCLYLNVWTPAKSANEKLPVLVYFYGGGFSAGDGSEYRYDGESLAKMGIVTITINYRLGVFGFLAHPDLTNESPHHSSGNYGLMDQHAALLWVKKNIAAFGGDPNKVTIGGESAGSMSVSVQVASPLSKGLFRGAIAESGAGMGNLTPAPLADAEQNGIKFAQKAGAATIADLRKIPADSLLKMSGLYRFGPDIDGYFLPQTPTAISVAGMEMHVPLLAGWNSAEGDYHGILGNDSITVDNYKAVLKRLYGANADAIFNAYPAATPYEVKVAATSLASDRFIAYSTWKFIDLQSKTGGKPVYRYFFSQVRQPAGGSHDTVMGASHSSEIEYALGNLATNKAYSWSADDYKVSETMESYFANFIKTGDPNGPGLPQWYSLQTRPPRIMVIDINTHAEPEKNAQRYMLLDSLYKQANQVK